MADIILDVSTASRVKVFNKNELLQHEAFGKINEILGRHLEYIESLTIADKEKISSSRTHDTIFINGDRGLGKTAFMVNIEESWNRNKCQDPKLKLKFFNPIDPTLLDQTEQFLVVILGLIVQGIQDLGPVAGSGVGKESSNVTDYYRSLQDLSDSLRALKTVKADEGIEEIASRASSLILEQRAHNFFETVTKMYGVEALVLLIDDVDMAFERGFDVLEVVRKYLASPYIIPVVAGDMNLYKRIVRNQFIKNMNFRNTITVERELLQLSSEDKLREGGHQVAEMATLLTTLTTQYLKKVFPTENNIQLKPLFEILREDQVSIKIADDKLIPYTDLKDFEITVLNAGNNRRDKTFTIFEDNPRSFLQYLSAKRDIFRKFFIEPPEKFKEYCTYGSPGNSELVDIHLKKMGDSLLESFKISADIYRYSDILETKKHVRLLDADISAKNNGKDIYLAYKENIFSAFKIGLENRERPTGARNILTVSKDANKIPVKAMFSDGGDDSKGLRFSAILFCMSTYDDYRSADETSVFLTFKGIIDFLLFSLSLSGDCKKIQTEDLPEQVAFSFTGEGKWSVQFEKCRIHCKDTIKLINAANGSIENVDRIDPVTKMIKTIVKARLIDSSIITAFFKDGKNMRFLHVLSQNIMIWHRTYAADNVLFSPVLSRVLDHFEHNHEALLNNYLPELTPLNYLQRCTLIFLNAVAYFESSETVAISNIAHTKSNVSNPSIQDYAHSSTPVKKNILPLLAKDGSLTKALFMHPLVHFILLDYENSSFEKLCFADFSGVVKKEENKIKDIVEGMKKKVKMMGDKEKIEILLSYLNDTATPLETREKVIKELKKTGKHKVWNISCKKLDEVNAEQELCTEYKHLLENSDK